MEIGYEASFDFIKRLAGDEKRAKTLFPFIGTLFVFIASSSLLHLLPGLESITFHGERIFRAPTSDFNTTFALALGALIIIQIASIADFGVLGYFGKFFKFKEVYHSFKKGISSGLIGIVEFFIGLLEIISELSKVISLSLRLFGNIYAGMILVSVALGAMAYILPTIVMVSEAMFGLIQTIVFGSLVAIYYILSTKP